MRYRETDRDITPLLTSLVAFQDDGRRTSVAASMLMEEGDVARKEADAAMVRLVAVFLQVASAAAKLTDAEEGT